MLNSYGESKGQEVPYVKCDHEIENRVKKKITDKFSDVLDDEVMAEILKIAEKQALKRYMIKRTEENENP